MTAEFEPAGNYQEQIGPREAKYRELLKLYSGVTSPLFDLKNFGISDFVVYETTVVSPDFTSMGLRKDVTDCLLGTAPRISPLNLIFKRNGFQFGNTQRQIKIGLNFNLSKFFWGIEIETPSFSSFGDSELLKWTKGIVGQEEKGFGRRKEQDPFNPEHITHDFGMSKAFIDTVGKLIETGRLNKVYEYANDFDRLKKPSTLDLF